MKRKSNNSENQNSYISKFIISTTKDQQGKFIFGPTRTVAMLMYALEHHLRDKDFIFSHRRFADVLEKGFGEVIVQPDVLFKKETSPGTVLIAAGILAPLENSKERFKQYVVTDDYVSKLEAFRTSEKIAKGTDTKLGTPGATVSYNVVDLYNQLVQLHQNEQQEAHDAKKQKWEAGMFKKKIAPSPVNEEVKKQDEVEDKEEGYSSDNASP